MLINIIRIMTGLTVVYCIIYHTRSIFYNELQRKLRLPPVKYWLPATLMWALGVYWCMLWQHGDIRSGWRR